MRRKSDRIISIKLVFEAEVLNVICVYAPQMGLTDDIKKVFWEELEEVLQSVPRREKLFLGVILMAILERRLMGMLERMGVSSSGIEIVEEWYFLTLL